MLEEVPEEDFENTVWRFASRYDISQTLKELGLEQIDYVELLQLTGLRELVPDDFLDGPFTPKLNLPHPPFGWSRFSNGKWPIFYASLDKETAQTEVVFWFQKTISPSNSAVVVMYYNTISCQLSARARDLRPMTVKWPSLLEDTDYEYCQRLGREAHQTEIPAFITQSVRRTGGTNTPVFSRDVLHNAVIGELVKFEMNVDSRVARITPVSS